MKNFIEPSRIHLRRLCWVLAFLAACSNEDAPTQPVVGRIGPQGGVVEVLEGPLAGASVKVPPGALAADATLTIEPGLAATDFPAGFGQAGPIVEFGPTGQTFAVPVTLTVPVNSPGDLRLFTRSKATDPWVEVPGAYRSAGTTSRLSGEVNHFTSFVALELRRIAGSGDQDGPGPSLPDGDAGVGDAGLASQDAGNDLGAVGGQGGGPPLTVGGQGGGPPAPVSDGGVAVAPDKVAFVNIVGYWAFNGSASSPANGNAGQILKGLTNNSPAHPSPTWVGGKHDRALLLNGVDEWVVVPSSASVNTIVDTVTFAAWIKVDSVQGSAGNVAYIVSRRGGALPQFGLGLVENHPTCTVQSYELRSPTTIPIGQWVHLAITNDSFGCRIYQSGVLQATLNNGLAGQTLQTPLVMGARLDGSAPTGFFAGAIDDVRVYNRQLIDEEIQAIAK